MNTVLFIALGAVIIIGIVIGGRVSRAKRDMGESLSLPAAPPPTPASTDNELVVVIAAAVAAASGMSTSQFRIVAIEPSAQSGGFNTPVWGHADRFGRASV